MKYVSVRHKPNHTKVWWFSVPKELDDLVYVGADVLCVTKKGNASGKIVSVMDGFSEEQVAKLAGINEAFKSIIAVGTDFSISDIHIPLQFKSGCPTPEKISRRMTEFYATGKFNTPVILTSDGTLRDGYTAYLVAKMFEHETLHGFVCLMEDV